VSASASRRSATASSARTRLADRSFHRTVPTTAPATVLAPPATRDDAPGGGDRVGVSHARAGGADSTHEVDPAGRSGGSCGGGGRGARSRPAPSRPAAQLPRDRPRALLHRGRRARAAPVRGGRQRRGAALQPDQRRWVYASSKLENNYFGFGTDNDVEHAPSYPIVKHATFARVAPPSSPPAGQQAWVPCAKILGGARQRRGAFRQDSVVNLSAMSFGSLSGAGRRGPEPGCRHRRVHAEHGGGRPLTAPPPRRRPRVPDRHRLLRLP
jgi:hypothetical protein